MALVPAFAVVGLVHLVENEHRVGGFAAREDLGERAHLRVAPVGIAAEQRCTGRARVHGVAEEVGGQHPGQALCKPGLAHTRRAQQQHGRNVELPGDPGQDDPVADGADHLSEVRAFLQQFVQGLQAGEALDGPQSTGGLELLEQVRQAHVAVPVGRASAGVQDQLLELGVAEHWQLRHRVVVHPGDRIVQPLQVDLGVDVTNPFVEGAACRAGCLGGGRCGCGPAAAPAVGVVRELVTSGDGGLPLGDLAPLPAQLHLIEHALGPVGIGLGELDGPLLGQQQVQRRAAVAVGAAVERESVGRIGGGTIGKAVGVVRLDGSAEFVVGQGLGAGLSWRWRRCGCRRRRGCSYWIAIVRSLVAGSTLDRRTRAVLRLLLDLSGPEGALGQFPLDGNVGVFVVMVADTLSSESKCVEVAHLWLLCQEPEESGQCSDLRSPDARRSGVFVVLVMLKSGRRVKVGRAVRGVRAWVQSVVRSLMDLVTVCT